MSCSICHGAPGCPNCGTEPLFDARICAFCDEQLATDLLPCGADLIPVCSGRDCRRAARRELAKNGKEE